MYTLPLHAATSVVANNALPTLPMVNGQIKDGYGFVTGGSNTNIVTDGLQMNITQNDLNAVIKWGSFDVGGSATVNFKGPESGYNTLNYVNAGGSMSQIYGTINANNNGNIFIVNPAGVQIGNSAQINVGSLYVSNKYLNESELKGFAGTITPEMIDATQTADAALMSLGNINATNVTFEGDGRIVIDDIIGMQDVSISANARSFGEVISDLPSSLSIDIDMSVSDIEIETVEVVFNPEITVDDQTVEIGEMPEFLSEEGNRLDLYSPVITLMVTNDSPVSAVLQADITSYSNDSQTASIHLGNEDAGAADAVVLRSGVTPVYIVRRAEDVPDGPVAATNDPVIIVRDDLSELIATIPDKMTVSDIDVRVLQETIEFDLVNAPDKYSFSFGYDINVPLAFGEELAVSYPYDITGLNETLNPSSSDDNGSLEIDFSEASVFLTFVNEIPLDLSVAASPIDKDGNVIGSGIDVELTGIEGNSAVTVGAGNVGSPSESPAVIRIRADRESLMKLDGFRLDLKGSCGSGFAGVALNENQGIQLKDISVNIKGGVSTQF